PHSIDLMQSHSCCNTLSYSSLSSVVLYCSCYIWIFFFNCPTTPQISTLSLHDALPILMLPGSKAPTGPSSSTCGSRMTWPSEPRDRKSTRLNSSHVSISYAVFCLKKKNRFESCRGRHISDIRTQMGRNPTFNTPDAVTA